MKTIQLRAHSALTMLAFLLLLGRAAPAQPATPGYAVQLDGSSGYVSTTFQFDDPQTFTIAIWFNTTTTQGGRLLGFGNEETGTSGSFDRHLYMDNNGHIIFGINPGSPQIISNTVACNDGNWHQAVGTLSSGTGLSLYIDGELATNHASFNTAQNYNGYWRIGYDSLNTWPHLPTSDFFNGTIDEVQIWNIVLNSNQIQTNLHLFRTGTESGLVSYWHFDEGTGPDTVDSSGFRNLGILENGVTWVVSTAPIGLPQVTDQAPGGVTASVATLNGVVLPNYQQTGAWFQYGLTTGYGLTTPQSTVGSNNSASVSVSQNISGLQQGLYHYRLVATNSAGTNLAADSTFTTLLNAQFLLPVTLAASRMTGNGVILNGSLNPYGVDAKAWFEWGPTMVYGNSTPATDAGSGSNPVTVSARLSGLQGGQLYHYHLAATNAFGKFIGVDHVLEVPLLGLYGDNPLTNCFGVAFVDPGFGLAPASPLAIAASDNDELGVDEDDFGLALTGDGTVVGWGYNKDGETNVPSGMSNVVAIATGDRFSLALEADGTVVNWGVNENGALTPPASLSNVVAIAAGGNGGFSLALQSDGTVVGWGGDADGEIDIPFGLGRVVAIAAGDNFSLALQSDGTVVSWGYNFDGKNTPPSGLSNVVAIAAGNDFSLALQSDGTVVGWGENAYDYDETPIPSGLTNVVAISVGGYFGMVLQSDGSIVGWGTNSALGGFQAGWDLNGNKGEIAGGLKFGLPAGTPAVQSSTLVAIAAGNDFSLAFAGNGTVVGGGDNAYGNLDIPSGLNVSSAPITVTGTVNVNVPGVYTLVYTVTNFMGAVDTVTRAVVVTPPPPPTGFTMTNIAKGQFALQFTGNSNVGYSVLASTNIALPLVDWTVLGQATSLSNNLFQYIDTKATNIQDRFYILRWP